MILIPTFAITILGTWILVCRKDWGFALWFIFLFLYTIFTQTALAYYPDLVARTNLSFSPETERKYFIFVNSSLLLIFLGRWWILARRERKARHFARFQAIHPARPLPFRNPLAESMQRQATAHARAMIVLCGLAYSLSLLVAIVASGADLAYATEGGAFSAYPIFIAPTIGVMFYAIFRMGRGTGLWNLIFGFVLLLIVPPILYIMLIAGKRLPIVALMSGIVIFEWLWSRGRKTNVMRGLLTAIVVGYLVVLYSDAVVGMRSVGQSVSLEQLGEELKAGGTARNGTLMERLIANDALVPSLLMLEAIEKDIVVPAEVAKSTLMNTLVLLKYPQMNELMGRRIRTDFSRNESYAYYILNEGFQFAGWLGIFYNAFIINVGFCIWEQIYRGHDRRTRILHNALIATLFIVAVRAGSFWFIKGFYLALIPVSLLGRVGIRALGRERQ